MKVLVVATRTPYPPRDGGALLITSTIEGLIARGHQVTLVAPDYSRRQEAGVRRQKAEDRIQKAEDRRQKAEDRRQNLEDRIQKTDQQETGALGPQEDSLRLRLVPASRRPLAGALAGSVVRRRPVSIERHVQKRVAATVATLLGEEAFDVVHVEQLQGLAQASPALDRRVPVVLRAQNVESELWRMLSRARPGWRILAALEGRRLARWEAAAVTRVSATVALTTRDLQLLESMAPTSRVRLVRMPMPAVLPARAEPLPGMPSIVVLGSAAFFPNRDGAAWFLRDLWPTVSSGLPNGRLHVFGLPVLPSSAPRVELHPAPRDSRDAFPFGSILAVPLRIASGARVRILEAWARGIPVVATPHAAAGLDVEDGRGLLVARTAEEFLDAFRELSSSRERVRQVVEEGRALLRRWHDPERMAAELEEVYREAIAASAARAE